MISLIDYNTLKDLQEFNAVYEVHEALITERIVRSTSYYTDSAMQHTLVELEFDDFGSRTVNLMKSEDGINYQMRFQEKYVTTDIKMAVKEAVKGYKLLTEKKVMKQSLTSYFGKFAEKYPELMI